MKIAVDAMGGDFAPQNVIEGAVQAASDFGQPVVLVGREEAIIQELKRLGDRENPNIEICHAEEIIGMLDSPSAALRKKKNSSLHVAARLVREGKADGLVSAGHTGAVFMICKLIIGALEGVERPALAAILPTKTQKKCVMLDVGANVDCKPVHLKEFAVMGHFYSREILGTENPRIGLLSIGEEEGKGNEFTREVFKILKETNLNFVGNVEGKSIFEGTVDVIVCDGFVGNLVLKSCESLADLVRHTLRSEMSSHLSGRLAGFFAKGAMEKLRRRIDYSEYGGAPLLGIRGNCIVSHGRSNANAIRNAIRVAREWHLNQVNQRIEGKLAELSHDRENRGSREASVSKEKC